MRVETIDTKTVNPIMSMSEAEGRGRQWIRDIKEAQEVFQKRLPLVTNITGSRKGHIMRSIKGLAEKVLAPAFVLSRYTSQGGELYLMDTNEKNQLMLTKILVDHDGQIETFTMHFYLSLHCIARFLQYWRVREKNPMAHQKVRALMASIPQIDGQTLHPKILVQADDGVYAEICCALEELNDGTVVQTATTFIINTSLNPERSREAEKMSHLVEPRGFVRGQPGTEVLKNSKQKD